MEKRKMVKPTEAELEILQVLWENGPSTVRFVNERLSMKKRVGYTTTLKIMQIMTDKNLVRRNEDGRSHIYRAVMEREETQGLLLDRFLHSTFGGSAMKLVVQALGNHKPSKDELEQIKELIKQIEGGSENGIHS
ncbi:MAG: BlaI/MecI/CopY family transcriptional regulator [Bacteroidales bacterium]|nr:MAG: BlaI/MecI/CopY family transcriptional regulator [Bacteroidales bacterium]